MKDKTIAVVMGGPSAERDVSLRTGDAISKALKEKGYKVECIDLQPENFFEQLKSVNAQVVFNAIHGIYGEDGKIQGFLDMLKIPYTGSGLEACALSMNKIITKQMFLLDNIPTAKFLVFKKSTDKNEIISKVQAFGLPVVIKPPTQGSTIGISIVREIGELEQALEIAFTYGNDVLIEEFIKGREFTASVITDNNQITAYPIIEIVPHSGAYDYHSKYTTGATTYTVPAQISDSVRDKMQQIAKEVYASFNCRGVARVDYMMDDKENLYVLEINTVPGMTQTSLVPKAAAALGISFADVCEKILFSARV